MPTPEERFESLVSGAGSAPLTPDAVRLMARLAGMPDSAAETPVDDLAETLAIGYDRMHDRPLDCDRKRAQQAIDAGWRKRRVIHTLKELKALPTCAVIKIPASYMPLNRSIDGWDTIDFDGYKPNHHWLPAIVLWDPSEEQP